MIWFSSDHHFFHNNVIGFCDRPFRNLDEMHTALITAHNIRVKSKDTCIFVGDFSFGNATRTREILSQMNGHKILVRGNHDKPPVCNSFGLVVDELSMRIEGHKVSVKHYPLKFRFPKSFFAWVRQKVTRSKPPRYLDRRPIDRGQYHIHGHVHSKIKFNENQIHVGVDANKYGPVSIKEISRYIQRRENKRKQLWTSTKKM